MTFETEHFNPLFRWQNDEGCCLVEEPINVVWNGRELTVPIKFKTDLASIPRVALSLVNGKFGKHILPAIVHDYLYRTTDHDFTREEADEMFLDGMEAAGVYWLRRKAMYSAVRAGGWLSWQS